MIMINRCENISKQIRSSSNTVYGFESNFSLMSQLASAEEGSSYNDIDNYYHQRQDNSCLGSDLALIEVMAEDESRTGSINETGSSSKDNNDTNKGKDKVEEEEEEEEEGKGWLQLSIGGHTSYMPTNNKPEGMNTGGSSGEGGRGGGGLVELDLLPTVSSDQQGKSILGNNSSTVYLHEFRAPPPPTPTHPRRQQFMTAASTTITTSTTSSFLQQHPGVTGGTSSTTMFPQHQQELINWGFRPMQPIIQQNINLSLVSPGSHFGPGPFPVLGGACPGPSSIDFRVIHPPRRPHSGLWFSLQPSSNQTREPFLPQISKSYLRIKDGRMTIRLVLKYLVNKLQLENESEIEITCRGQQLQPFLTLQHVRDHIWSITNNAADNILTFLPSETSNHVMVLHYARRSTTTTTSQN